MTPIEWIGFAKFAEQIGELLKKLRGEKDRRSNEAAAYFQQLSAAMQSVVDSLRKNEVPRISGNEMNTLIHAFPMKTKGVFATPEASETSALLASAALTAKTLDASTLANREVDGSEREEHLAVLERITGHCRALAGILRKAA